MNIQSKKTKRDVLLMWLGILLLIFSSCSDKATLHEEFVFSGTTMGTTYHIIIVKDSLDIQQRSSIPARVDSFLGAYNQIFSTFEDQSEISRFNRSKTMEPVTVSPKLLQVVDAGQEFCIKSGGAFDITVAPIVNFFGFGFETGAGRFPTVDEIDAWLQLTGCDKLELGDSSLTKSDPRVSIDLSAIAKGDASDEVADLLVELGFENVFVEIGGEIKTHGFNKSGKSWRVGIDRPSFDATPGADLQHVIQLSDMGVASSGDYRNYREVEGRRISHTIDPRTGSPIDHHLAAVTVIAKTCMLADALATSVMVLGPEEGLSWLEDYPEVEGVLITREKDGAFREFTTEGFKEYLTE